MTFERGPESDKQRSESSIPTSMSLWVNKLRLDILNHPTYAILDLGCRRATGSRVVFKAACAAARLKKLSYTLEPSTATFGFANSQQSVRKERLVVWFPTTPPSSTIFQIVEEGNVPLLMSLAQMTNLHFDLQCTRDGGATEISHGQWRKCE